jgi:Helix-turn-helix domain
VTWRGRIARELLTGAGYGALAEDIVAAVDSTIWPEGAQPAPEPAHHDVPTPTPAVPPATTPPEERELLTIKQLVAYSTLSERTLRTYLKRRVRPLPHYRVNKKILIRKVEFDEWLAHFRPVERVDEIAQAVDEMLTGLTGPRPLADTRRHHTRRR